MKKLTREDYDGLYSQIVKILNEVDPLFYSGPEDEYDSYVNDLLSSLQKGQITSDTLKVKLKEIILGSSPSDAELKKVAELSSKLNPVLEEWM